MSSPPLFGGGELWVGGGRGGGGWRIRAMRRTDKQGSLTEKAKKKKEKRKK